MHPAVGHRDGTLVNALLHRSKDWAGPADRPGLVHRLDKDTSGVLVIAKTERAMAVLGKAMKERSLEKEYLAVVYGKAPLQKGKIDLEIRRDPADRKRMATSKSEGRASSTFYEILSESSGPLSGLSLLKCRLVTGRTHQIRVHLKALNLPIVGDSGLRLAALEGPEGRRARARPARRSRARRCTRGASAHAPGHRREDDVHRAGPRRTWPVSSRRPDSRPRRLC